MNAEGRTQAGAAQASAAPSGDDERELTLPDAQLAKALLAERPYDERFTVAHVSPSAGNERHVIYSLGALVDDVEIAGLDHPLRRGGHTTVTLFDPKALIDWVGRVFGDAELAAALARQQASGASYLDKVVAMRALIARRLQQAQEVLNGDGPTPD